MLFSLNVNSNLNSSHISRKLNFSLKKKKRNSSLTLFRKKEKENKKTKTPTCYPNSTLPPGFSLLDRFLWPPPLHIISNLYNIICSLTLSLFNKNWKSTGVAKVNNTHFKINLFQNWIVLTSHNKVIQYTSPCCNFFFNFLLFKYLAANYFYERRHFFLSSYF